MQGLQHIMFGVQVVAVALLLVETPAAQPAERRVALVIGNGQYHHVPRLANPTNDARLIAETLMALGFALVGGQAQLDLDKTSLDRMVQEFGLVIQTAGVALFFYAGHGIQVRGANYLVPVNANPTREADVDFQMVNADLVLRQMEGAGTRLNLVILDACRNNPFTGRGIRAAGGGLAQMQAPEGTLISYATQPGNVALDGTDGHSPYTRALAHAFKKPGLDLFAVFNETGLEVKKRTGRAQQPWVSSSPIAGQFYFAGAPDPRPAVLTRPPSATTSGNDDAVEIAFWNSVKDAKNPDAFHTYLQQYPQGKFVSLATLKLKELTAPPQSGAQVEAFPPSSAMAVADQLYNRALQDFQKKNWEAAVVNMKRYLQAMPKSPQAGTAQYLIGESLYAQKQYEPAIVAFDEVVQKYPTDPKVPAALLKQGYAFLEIKDFRNARFFLQQVQKKFPGSLEAQQAAEKLHQLR